MSKYNDVDKHVFIGSKLHVELGEGSKDPLYCIHHWYMAIGHKKRTPIESCSNEEKGFYIVICSNELDLFTVV